jgi:hypothetical protein
MPFLVAVHGDTCLPNVHTTIDYHLNFLLCFVAEIGDKDVPYLTF